VARQAANDGPLRLVGAAAGVGAGAVLAVFIFRLAPADGVRPLAALADLALVAAFCAAHSLTASRRVKRRLDRVSPALPRAAHLLLTAAGVAAIAGLWQTVGGTVWSVGGAGAGAMDVAYWLLLGLGTLAILKLDALAFFGLRQERPDGSFAVTGAYRIVRHPLYAVVLAAIACAPRMGLDRLLLLGAFAAYLAAAVPREEARLVDRFGDAYLRYRAAVPAVLPGVHLGRWLTGPRSREPG
jgi:protein-S-isoprenylcysteine O-methyltransferase Ste14